MRRIKPTTLIPCRAQRDLAAQRRVRGVGGARGVGLGLDSCGALGLYEGGEGVSQALCAE